MSNGVVKRINYTTLNLRGTTSKTITLDIDDRSKVALFPSVNGNNNYLDVYIDDSYITFSNISQSGAVYIYGFVTIIEFY